jgi:hypothetical protein
LVIAHTNRDGRRALNQLAVVPTHAGNNHVLVAVTATGFDVAVESDLDAIPPDGDLFDRDDFRPPATLPPTYCIST